MDLPVSRCHGAAVHRLAAPAALATTVVLWASAFAAIREAVRALGWAHLSVLRLAIAALALGAIAAGRRVRWPARRDLPLLGLCALSGMTAYQVLLNAGEVTVPAATASLLVNVSPIFTALMAVALLGERLSARGWCGVVLGFAGAALIALAAGGGVRLSAGALLVLGAALAQATFFVSQKALLRRHGSLAVTAWAMGLGAALALPLAPGLPHDVAGAPSGALIAVAFLAFGASALGFWTWAYAVARIDVTAAASTLYAVPPVAALVGWVALGEVGQRAPAAADLEQVVGRAQVELGADGPQLVQRGLLERRALRREDRRRVHHPLVEEQLEQLVAEVVVGGDLAAAAGDRVAPTCHDARGRQQRQQPAAGTVERLAVARRQAHERDEVGAVPHAVHVRVGEAEAA